MKKSLPELVTELRFKYHSNMLDVVNVANQLHILSDEKAEQMNKNHCMTIFEDLLPRMTGLSVEQILEEAEKNGTLEN